MSWPSHWSIRLQGDIRIFETVDLPDHPTGRFPIAANDPASEFDKNPNGIQSQHMRVELPTEPKLSSRPTCAPGAIGFLTTGIVLFSAIDAPGDDAPAHEMQDHCQGHPKVGGVYHYHNLSSCAVDKRQTDGHSSLVGYALDGFGIFGLFDKGGRELSSADLDECHGHSHAVMWDGHPKVMYHYHATKDFPYTVGCMRGAYKERDVETIAGPPVNSPSPGSTVNARKEPDLAAAARKLNLSEDVLRRALGPPPPDLRVTAQKLGVTVEALHRALGVP